MIIIYRFKIFSKTFLLSIHYLARIFLMVKKTIKIKEITLIKKIEKILLENLFQI